MRFVYDYDEEAPGGRELLGGKGVGLAEMTALGVPVPAGFTITTDACRAYMASGKQVPDGLDDEVGEHIAALEARAAKRFGDPSDPLLVSVRSGAAVSMPGMMDTILNLGPERHRRRGPGGGDRECAVCLRLLPAADPDVRRGGGRRRRSPLRERASSLKAARGVANDVDLDADDLRELIGDVPAHLRGGGRQRASRRIRVSSCDARIAPCSTPGMRRGRRSTVVPTRSLTISAPLSTSSRWCSGTRAKARARVSASRATRRRARRHLRRVPRQRAG